jgi:FG-GAP-like repeat/Abnormal spindle-like microcephaly-assoc'd, ASPM-SPD-2-Hydin/Beta-propeller repeat
MTSYSSIAGHAKWAAACTLLVSLVAAPGLAQSPVLSTYLGGSGVDAPSAVAMDPDGNAYVIGSTTSPNFAGGGCSGTLAGPQNIFVAQITAAGALGWCLYIGGTGSDAGNGITLDPQGNIYIAGSTTSTGLGTSGSFQSTLAGPQDGIVCELTSSGAVVWCTYLGGGGSSQSNSIVVDSTGAAYVTGYSTGPGYPIQGSDLPGTSYGGGNFDAVATKINPGGGSLAWSTYLGGYSDDVGYAIQLASDGTIYLAGYTASSNFPVTSGAFQIGRNAARTSWVAHLGLDGSLLESSLLGGTSNSSSPCNSCASALTLDSSGNVWVAGLTQEANFPVTRATAAQATFGGGLHDAFIVEMNPSLSTELYGTFIGGSGDDGCVALAFDESGDLWCHGNTFSENFPTLDPFQSASGGPPDAFLLELSPLGAMKYSTYLGGSNEEYGGATQSIAVSGGVVWMTGYTQSTNFPLVNPIQSALPGTQAGFIAEFSENEGAPLVSLTPASLAFGNQQIGTSGATQAVTLANTGTAPLAVSGINFGGANGADFLQTNNCGSTVAGGSSCTIEVSFAPAGTGNRSASLTIADNTPSSPQSVSLSGTGTAPAVSLTPTNLSFGNQAVSTTSAVQNVILTNTGTGTLTLSSMGITGTNGGDFSQTNNCGGTLVAGANCTIAVSFTPAATGARSAVLNIADNAPGSPQTVSLSGTGTAPAVSLTPASLNFGNEYLGSSSGSQSVTLNNTGNATLTITGITIGPDFAQTNNCGTSLAAGASCSFSITFAPTTAGPLTESLLITDNVPGSPQSVTLSGTGLVPAPQVLLSPSALAFGNQVIGTTSSSQPVTLTNTGNAPLTVMSVAPSGDFALATTGTSCPYTGGVMNPAASCTIDVTFTPTSTGTRTGVITVIDNAAGSPQAVGLSGIGTSGLTSGVPQINLAIPPGAAVPGASGITLTVNGVEFAPGAVVDWNGNPLVTNQVSGQQLTATVPASDLAAASTASVTVVNPAPGGGASNVVYFPVTNPTPSVWLSRTDVATGNGPQWAGTGDFNQDGKPDLAIANSIDNTVSILLGNGDGTFTSQPVIAAGAEPVFGATGDLNGDGITDLAVADEAGNTVSILLGTGGGNFAPASTVATGNAPVALALGDLNADGALDLAVANQIDGTVSILLGNDDGTFSTSLAPVSVGNGPTALIAADLNGDGVLDLAVANSVDGTISILFGNGDGTFTAQPVIPLAPGVNSLVVADFNGDGVPDLAVGNTTTNSISILLGAGGGSFNSAAPLTAGNGPSALSVGDWNGDGVLDLTVANSIDSTVEVLLGNGDGSFQAGLTFATGSGPASVAAADFNGDGRLDLAAADNGSSAISVMMQAPQASLAPSSLTYGNQSVGTSSAAQSVTLTDTGTAALSIGGIAVTGSDSGDFTETNTCGATVAAGANCTINVTFTPTTSGSRTAAIAVTNNAAGSPQTVALSGTGTAPAGVASPASLTFGNQLVGTSSSPQVSTLTNTGSATLTITSIAVTGANSGDFSQSNNCGSSLGAGASCNINVTFTPQATGTRTASVTIADNAGNSPESVALSGTATAPGASLSPAALSFGNQQVGTASSPQIATLTNTGTAALTINSIAISGANNGDFTETNNCGISLTPGATCNISVTFAPTAAGARLAAVTVTDNATGSPQTVTLTGTGTTPAGVASPANLTFGNQLVGSGSGAQVTALTNTGSATLTIASIAVTGANSSDFSQSNNCGSSLGAGASCNISVTFSPQATGTRTASVTVSDNSSGGPQTVALTGIGVQPAISLSPASLTFSSEGVGSKSAGKTVTLTNTGTATLTLTSIGITGTDSGDFSQTTTCGNSVTAGAKCTITVTFDPTASGARTASLSVVDNAPASPQTVALSGTGTGPAVTLSPSSLTYGNQKVGTSSATQKITLTNSGSSPLTISAISITGVDSADFTETNTCPLSPSTLANGKTCTITVTFAPRTGGTLTASLSVTDNASGDLQAVSLSGTGTAVQFSPTSLNFGSLKVGKTSSAKSITLTNLGNTPLSISAISITGTDSADFNQTNTCGSTVGAGQSCSINVTFTPQATGSRSASISVTDNGGASPQMVALIGTGS